MSRSPSSKKKAKKDETPAIYEEIEDLLEQGETVGNAFVTVADRRETTPEAVRGRYYRFKGKVEAVDCETEVVHGNAKLSRKQEEALVALILWKASMSKPFTIPAFLDLVGALHFEGKRPHHSWLSRFLRNNQEHVHIETSQ